MVVLTLFLKKGGNHVNAKRKIQILASLCVKVTLRDSKREDWIPDRTKSSLGLYTPLLLLFFG